jgi:hypothetical protein
MKLEPVNKIEPVWLLPIVLLLSVSTFFLLPQPATNFDEPTITILNEHSHPQVGGNWSIYFNTTGAGVLQVNDHSFPEEVAFVNLYRRSGPDWWAVPVTITGDLISADWSYDTGKAVFHVKTPEEHVLEFRYGDAVAYAFNYAELYISVGTPKSVARGQDVPVIGNARNHNLSDVTLIYDIPQGFKIIEGEATLDCGGSFICESNLTLDTTEVPDGVYVIKLDACTYGTCGSSTTEVRVDRLIVGGEEPQFYEAIVGEPVRWTQKLILENPFGTPVYNYKIPVPYDAFDISPSIIPEVGPHEAVSADVTFYTMPVEVTVSNENLDLSRMVPQEASDIKIYDDEGLLFSPADYNMFKSLEINFPADRVQVYHNASLHYQNIPVAVPASTDTVSLFEDINGTRLETVNFTLRDDVVAWTVPHLSTRIYWVTPETFQLKRPVGNNTLWTLEIKGFKTEYETITGTPSTGLINVTWHTTDTSAEKPIKIKATKPHYKIDEEPEFDVELSEDKGINVRLKDSKGRTIFVEPEITKTAGGKYNVKIPKERGFKPGLHKLEIETADGIEVLEFAWGLITINTKKSLYHPGETAEIIMVVLDREGYLVSGANVDLTVTNPAGTPQTFSTGDGSIFMSQQGIYKAYYNTTLEGTYTMAATAAADGVTSDIESYFLANSYYEFDILRDMPVTIDPQRGPFEAKIKVISYTNTNTLTLREYLPAEFDVTAEDATITTVGDAKVIEWTGLTNGSEVTYSYNTPFVWPYMYQMGPAEIDYDAGTFVEARAWMLAVDPGEFDCVIRGVTHGCEEFIDLGITDWDYNDNDFWVNVATWTVGNPCPGTASTCFLTNISVFGKIARYNTGTVCGILSIMNATAGVGGTQFDFLHAENDTTMDTPWQYYTNDSIEDGGQIADNICDSLPAAYPPAVRPDGPYNMTNESNFTAMSYPIYIGGKATGGGGAPVAGYITAIKYTWAWIRSAPTVNNVDISPGTGGWGETFNFTAYYEDPQSQNGNVSVWDAFPNAPSTWYEINKTTSVASGSNVSLTYNFSLSNFSGLSFPAYMKYKFEANDSDTNNDTSAEVDFNITRDNVKIELAGGNNSFVNRSDSRTDYNTTLSTRVYDYDNGTYIGSGIPGTVWITHNVSKGFEVGDQSGADTNASGYLRATATSGVFNPGCSYVPGEQRWYMETTSTDNYTTNTSLDNYNSNFTITIVGELQNTIISPDPGTTYSIGNNITFSGTIVDDCSLSTTDATVIFNITNDDIPFSEECAASYNTSTSRYECKWDSTGKNEVDYNVTMMSNKSYHNNGTATSDFILSAKPILTGRNVSKSVAFWGETLNITINVTDSAGDTVNVSLYLKKAGGSWTRQNSSTCTDYSFNCTSCDNSVAYCTRSFTSSDIGFWDYRFNATDDDGNDNELPNPTDSFQIVKKNLTWELIAGDGDVSNRTDNQTTTLKMGLKDNSTSDPIVGENITFFVTRQSGIWDDGAVLLSDAEGNATYAFNATCSPRYDVGAQSWKAEIVGDNASYYSNPISDTYSLDIWGEFNNTLLKPPDPTKYQYQIGGDSVTFQGRILDDCTEGITSGVEINFTIFGPSTHNCTEDIDSIGGGIYECYLSTTSKPEGWYNATMNTSLNYYYNWSTVKVNDSREALIELYVAPTPPDLDAADVIPRKDGWSVNRTFTVNVTSGKVTNITVVLEVKPSGGGYVQLGNSQNWTSDGTSTATLTWENMSFYSENVSTLYNFKFTATDDDLEKDETDTLAEYTNSTSLEGYEINQFYIEKDTITINHTAGNNSIATLSQSVKLVVQVNDTDIGTTNVTPVATVYFNVTQAGEAGPYVLLGSNTTNETGHAVYYFLPTEDWSAGKQNWTAYVDDDYYNYTWIGPYNVTISLNKAPQYQNDKVNVSSEGWGQYFNFSVMTRDPESDDVNVTLWINTTATGGYKLYGSNMCYGCTNWNQSDFEITFTPGDVGSASFKFIVNDSLANDNETTPVSFTIERDDIYYTIIEGNNISVNRTNGTGNSIMPLIIKWQDENGTDLGTGITINYSITYDDNLNTWGYTNDTNGSGYSIYNINPGCASPRYEVGTRYWRAFIEGSSLYKDNSTPAGTAGYNLSINGTFGFELSESAPEKGKEYQREALIPFQTTLYDDCVEELPDATVTFFARNETPTTNTTFICSNVTNDVAEAVYGCTWDSVNGTQGWFDVITRANMSYYHTRNDTNASWFSIRTNPDLYDANVTPRSDSWVTNHNFTVKVKDNMGDNVNVTLQYQKIGQGWEDYGNMSCTNCTNTTEEYTLLNWTNVTFPCTGYAGENMKFRFVAQDGQGNPQVITVTSPTNDYADYAGGDDDFFVIEKADVLLENITGDTTATSLQPATFLVRAKDLDNNSYIFNTSYASPLIKFNVSNSSTTYVDVNQTAVNASGYAERQFNPLDSLIEPWVQEGLQNWTAYIPSTDTCYKENVTQNVSIVNISKAENDRPLYINESVNGVEDNYEEGWGMPWNFTVEVKDPEGDTVTVSLYIGGNLTGTKTCNSPCTDWTLLDFPVNFTPSNITTTNYYFDISDGLSNNTPQHTFTIEKDDIYYTLVEGNNIQINRTNNSGYSIMPLVVQWQDENGTNITNGVAINYSITYDDVPNSWGYSNDTNGSGYSIYNLNPGCALPRYEVGARYWRAFIEDSSLYKDNETHGAGDGYLLSINGTFGFSLSAPNTTDERNKERGEDITFQTTLYDDCGAELSGATIAFFARNETPATNTTFMCNDITLVSSVVYKCIWDTTNTTQAEYDVITQANKSYYFIRNETNASWISITTPPSLKYANVSPRSEGWGYPFNFTVRATDNVGDTVNVTFYTKVGTQAEQYVSAQNCTNCSSSMLSWSKNFTSSGVGQSVTFKFVGNDTENHIPYETLVAQGDYVGGTNSFDLEADDVNLSYVYNDSIIYRAGSNTATLILFANDTDRLTPAYDPAAKVYFNITNDTVNYENIFDLDGNNYNYSNSTGQVIFDFNATCNQSVGMQKWRGFISGNNTYKDNVSLEYNITVVGELVNNVTEPDGTSYDRGNSVLIRGRVTDECGNPILNINNTVAFGIDHTWNASSVSNCTSIVEDGNGYYNCTWDTSGFGGGWYNITMNSSAGSNYTNDSYMKPNAFEVILPPNEKPQLQNPTVIPAVEGWGVLRNFTVELYDNDNDNVTITFYLSSDGVDFTPIANKIVNNTNAPNLVVNFLYNFSTSNFTTNDTWAFRFNANDTNTTPTVNTTNATGATLEKDNVSINYVAGNNTIANRSGEQTAHLELQVNDTDNTSLIVLTGTSGNFNVTNATGNWDSGALITTTADGNLTYNFNATCEHGVGPQKWKGGTEADAYYRNNESVNYTLTVYGDLNNTNITTDKLTYSPGENVTITFNVTDECSSDIATLDATNFTITLAHNGYSDYCTNIENRGSGSYNCTWNTTSAWGGNYTITIESTNTYYNNGTESIPNAFIVQRGPTLVNKSVDPTESYWGSTYTFNVTVADPDDNVTVRLWHRENGTSDPWTQVGAEKYCYDCANYTMQFTYTYGNSEIKTWEWFINATDGNSETSTATNTTVVTKRNVTFILNSGNGTVVSRVDSGSAEKFFWVTTDSNEFNFEDAPDLPSLINKDFDPTCTYDVGHKVWIGGMTGHSDYYDANSSNYTLFIYSQLYANVTYPDNGSFQFGPVVTLNATVKDRDCGVVSGVVTNFTVSKTGYLDRPICSASDVGDGNYTCNQSTSTYPEWGTNAWYNVTFNFSKEYYNSTTFLKRESFRLAQYPNISNPTVDANVEGWGHNYTFNVTVVDADTVPSPWDVVNVSFWVQIGDSGSWEFVASESYSASTINRNFSFNKVFDCTDLVAGPIVYYKFNVTDSVGFTNESENASITLEKDNVSFTAVNGSAITINRLGTETGELKLTVNDTDLGQIVVNGVNVSF